MILAAVGVIVDLVGSTAPGTVVIVLVVPVIAEVVPVTVVEVPATVCVVNTTVATPLALVVEVAVAKLPLASDLVQVTVCPEVLTGLLLASAN
ncbi:hypothetical protein AQAU111925_06770 [Aquirufa aurantiipilula]